MWDPPPDDPSRADRYRDRIIFGFGYLSKGRYVGYGLGRVGEAAIDGVNWLNPWGQTSGPLPPKLEAADLESEVDDLVRDWHRTHPETPTFQLEIQRSQAVLGEGGSATLRVGVRPVSREFVWSDRFNIFVELAVLDGPGALSQAVTGIDQDVTLQATNGGLSSLFGLLSTQGSKIKVQARADGSVHGIILLPVTAEFTIGLEAVVEMEAAPTELSFVGQDGNDCSDVAVSAVLKTKGGDPIAGEPVHFELEGRRVATVTTDSAGRAASTVPICPWDVRGGEDTQTLEITAVYEGKVVGGANLSGAVAAATVTATRAASVALGGRITNARTGRALADVAVRIVGPDGTISATTDAQGSYRFSLELPPEPEQRQAVRLEITATRQGYLPATISPSATGSAFNIALDPQPPGESRRTHSVHDTVVDHLRPRPQGLVHFFQWNSKNRSGGGRVNVFVLQKRLRERRVAGQMRHNAKLDL